MRSCSAASGNWRISIDWIILGASFMCWPSPICCRVSNRITLTAQIARDEDAFRRHPAGGLRGASIHRHPTVAGHPESRTVRLHSIARGLEDVVGSKTPGDLRRLASFVLTDSAEPDLS